MPKHPNILQQFRSFCFENSATDIQKAIEYFSVFGGMGWRVDLSLCLDELIEQKVLKNYRYIHADITKITQSNPIHHKVLSALAMGDRREHSAFKKARIEKEDGEDSVDFLIDNGILIMDKSIEKPLKNYEKVSNKLLFTTPFMRFWFLTISPYYKGIKEQDYSEFYQNWNNTKQEFSHLIYQQLVMSLLKKEFINDPITNIGSYWDENVNIDILAKTKSGKLIAGSCKHSKSKANKSELTKLKEKTKQANLNIDTFVIYSKNRFSQELKKEKNENIKLYSLNSLKILIKNLNQKDILVSKNKKY